MEQQTIELIRRSQRHLTLAVILLGISMVTQIGAIVLWAVKRSTCTPSPAITVDADGTIVGVEAGVTMEERK